MGDIRVLAFAGSLRAGSFNRLLIDNAVRLAPEGMTIEHLHLDGLPNFSQDLEQNPPEIVRALKAKAREADGILIATPEYNFSFSSVTKSAIDWGSRPYGDGVWDGKPVAIMSASTGYMGGIRAQLHLRQDLNFFPMRQVYFPELTLSMAASKFDADGVLADDRATETLTKLLVALKDLIEKG